jgi:CRISPR associated protein Cas2
MSNLRSVPQLPWGWRSMWVIAMFDLPVDTPQARKAYTRFRKTLLEDGFTMMQYRLFTPLREHRQRGEVLEAHGRSGAVRGRGSLPDDHRSTIRAHPGLRREKPTIDRAFALPNGAILGGGRAKSAIESEPCRQGKRSKTRDGRNPQPIQRVDGGGGQCSKTRDGRNPQRLECSNGALIQCSKTRDGRNPQRRNAAGAAAPECSKTRDGRNPQHNGGRFDYLFKCSKTRDGRNPQPPVFMELTGTECSKTRDGRNPQQTG